MISASSEILILTALPDSVQAAAFGRSLVESRLAACVTCLDNAASVYYWKDKLTEEAEVLLLIKTDVRKLAAVESLFQESHPYEVPEFLVIDVAGISKAYQAWMHKELNL